MGSGAISCIPNQWVIVYESGVLVSELGCSVSESMVLVSESEFPNQPAFRQFRGFVCLEICPQSCSHVTAVQASFGFTPFSIHTKGRHPLQARYISIQDVSDICTLHEAMPIQGCLEDTLPR